MLNYSIDDNYLTHKYLLPYKADKYDNGRLKILTVVGFQFKSTPSDL
jgi:hypothetical protein